jgi:C1A family cysteine protease
MADGHCVGLSVFTYHFWTDGYAWREGRISLPIKIKPDGAHAVCLVAYQDEDKEHRDGAFTFKNSWGPQWGVSRSDPGFGTLPYRYVLQEGIEAWIIEVL